MAYRLDYTTEVLAFSKIIASWKHLAFPKGKKKKKKDGGNVFWHQKIYSQKHLNHKTQEKEISDFKCLKK